MLCVDEDAVDVLHDERRRLDFGHQPSELPHECIASVSALAWPGVAIALAWRPANDNVDSAADCGEDIPPLDSRDVDRHSQRRGRRVEISVERLDGRSEMIETGHHAEGAGHF